MTETNIELKEFLKETSKKNRDLPEGLEKYIDQFTLNGREFTRSIRNYSEKLIEHFTDRMRESTERPDFRLMVKTLGVFFATASKVKKEDYKGREYALKIRGIYRSLVTPRANKVYRNSGRRRIVAIDPKAMKVIRRKPKAKVEPVLTLSERMLKQMYR